MIIDIITSPGFIIGVSILFAALLILLWNLWRSDRCCGNCVDLDSTTMKCHLTKKVMVKNQTCIYHRYDLYKERIVS